MNEHETEHAYDAVLRSQPRSQPSRHPRTQNARTLNVDDQPSTIKGETDTTT